MDIKKSKISSPIFIFLIVIFLSLFLFSVYFVWKKSTGTLPSQNILEPPATSSQIKEKEDILPDISPDSTIARNIITTVDSTGDVDWYSSITIGTDGLPVIAYYDGINGDLKVLKCGNSSCREGE